jgi:HlyD family secretion protein
MADDKLFRKAALDKLASPERLDVLMQVTKPQDRIARWTFVGLAAAGMVWGFFGSMPERIPGEGQLRGGGGIQTIQAAGDGILTSLDLVENRTVAPDQLVATITSVGMEQDSEAARLKWMEAERLAAETRSAEAGTIADLQAQQRDLEGQLKQQQDRRATIKPAVDRGDLPGLRLIEIDREIERLRSRITEFTIQITGRQASIRSAESQARQAKIAYDQRTTTSAAVEQVTSTIAGRVVRVMKQQGDRVTRGDVLAEVETEAKGQALEVVAFVPASFGRKIAVGHPVQVTVAGIKREESGFLKGTVTFFSDAPVGPDRVSQITKESKGGGPSYEVRVAPTEDPATISRYAWSTGKGPPQQISGGVLVQIAVEVGERTPISLLLPYLRGLFGA